jgi:phosphate transport system protein
MSQSFDSNHDSPLPTAPSLHVPTTNNRGNYQYALSNLQDTLLDITSMVDKAIYVAIFALKTRNLHEASQVITRDKLVDQRRYQLEEEALTLLATQQPVLAHDLRMIAAVMHMAGELERMGDYAKGIAQIVTRLTFDVPTSIIVTFEEMVAKGRLMLSLALDAFIRHDLDQAIKVAANDDEIDVLYNEAYYTLLELMLADHHLIDEATMLLWVAHNLERLGDRITNICERIIFVETGHLEYSQKTGLPSPPRP